MQERLIELLENLFPEQPDTEQAATQILQLFRDEIKSLRVKYADYEGQAWNSALDSVLNKLEGKG